MFRWEGILNGRYDLNPAMGTHLSCWALAALGLEWTFCIW